MKTIVAMLIICWTQQPGGQIKEAWRIENDTPLNICLQMNQLFSGGGGDAVITVKCGTFNGSDH